MSQIIARSFMIISALFLICSNPVIAKGTLKQIPPSQFTALNINGESHGQFRGYRSFKFRSLSQDTTPKDLYYSPKTKLTYGLGNFHVFKGVDEDALFAFDTSGKQKWKVVIEERGYQQLIPAQDGTFYVYVLPSITLDATTPNVLYAFDLNGRIKWKYTFSEPQQMFSPVWLAGLHDSFYTVTNDSLVCIQNGKMVWEIKQPTIMNGLDLKQTMLVSIHVDHSGNIYTRDQDGWVEKRDEEHRLIWKEKLGLDQIGLVGRDRYLLAFQHTKHVYYSAETGKAVKNPDIGYTDFDRFQLPNDGKGGFYAAEKLDSYGLPAGNGIVKFNDKGQIIWHYKMRFNGYAAINFSSLMSDNKGNAYFLDNGGHLYSVDPNGNERFIVLTKDISGSYLSLYVSEDGVAVSSNGDVGTYMIQ